MFPGGGTIPGASPRHSPEFNAHACKIRYKHDLYSRFQKESIPPKQRSWLVSFVSLFAVVVQANTRTIHIVYGMSELTLEIPVPNVMFAIKWFVLYHVEKKRACTFAFLPAIIVKRNELLLSDVKCLTQLRAILLNVVPKTFGSTHAASKACVEFTAKVAIITDVTSQGARKGTAPT